MSVRKRSRIERASVCMCVQCALSEGKKMSPSGTRPATVFCVSQAPEERLEPVAPSSRPLPRLSHSSHACCVALLVRFAKTRCERARGLIELRPQLRWALAGQAVSPANQRTLRRAAAVRRAHAAGDSRSADQRSALCSLLIARVFDHAYCALGHAARALRGALCTPGARARPAGQGNSKQRSARSS